MLHLCFEELLHFARNLSQWNCSKETLSGRWVVLVFKTGTMLTEKNMEAAMWRYKSTSSGEEERSSSSKACNYLNGVIDIILSAPMIKLLYCNPVYIQFALLVEWFFPVFMLCPKLSKQLERLFHRRGVLNKIEVGQNPRTQKRQIKWTRIRETFNFDKTLKVIKVINSAFPSLPLKVECKGREG